MKKLILLIAIIGFFAQGHGQEMDINDVPVAVTDAFANTHPRINNGNWNKVGNNYSVNFTENNLVKSITWDGSGSLIGTNEEIIIASLPISLMVYVKKNYTENIVKEASKYTDPQGTITYKTEIKGMNLFFDSGGNFLKSVDH